MTDRFNTIAGWTLFAGIVALGLSILSGMYFHGDKPERPETMGYAIEGVVEEGAADEGPALATLLATGDPAAGQAVFSKCATCHTIDQGAAPGIGPNLWGVIGKPIGKHEPGFAYSSVLSDHGGEWTYENLDTWLTSPRAFAPGTKMTFAGLSKPEDRANVILYLYEHGGGPPLPEPPAEEPAAEGDAATAEAGDAAAATDAGDADAGAGEAGAAAASEPADAGTAAE